MPDLLRLTPWLIIGALLVFDVPGAISRRFLPELRDADATFLLQVVILFAVTLPWVWVFDGPSRALHPVTIGPLGVLCLYLAIDWARRRIPSDGSKAARALETRFSLAILVGYVVFLGLVALWWTQVEP